MDVSEWEQKAPEDSPAARGAVRHLRNPREGPASALTGEMAAGRQAGKCDPTSVIYFVASRGSGRTRLALLNAPFFSLSN